MKFILFDIDDIKYNDLHDVIVNENNEEKLKEIVFSRTFLLSIMKKPDGFLNKLRYNSRNRKFAKLIKKSLQNNKYKWSYILSDKFDTDERNFLKIKLQELLGFEYQIQTEMEKNIHKYIEDYIAINNKKIQELKILLIFKDLKNINFSFVKSLINNYKFVNIYLFNKPNTYVLNQIKKINNTFGSAIEIVKNDKKSLKEYDVVFFVDSNRSDFSKLRFNKNILVFDKTSSLEDKYNSNILYLNEYIKNNSIDLLEKLIKNYGKLKTAIAIKNLS